jgi:hypothetical protein
MNGCAITAPPIAVQNETPSACLCAGDAEVHRRHPFAGHDEASCLLCLICLICLLYRLCLL